jgi:hypothetical protein
MAGSVRNSAQPFTSHGGGGWVGAGASTLV